MEGSTIKGHRPSFLRTSPTSLNRISSRSVSSAGIPGISASVTSSPRCCASVARSSACGQGMRMQHAHVFQSLLARLSMFYDAKRCIVPFFFKRNWQIRLTTWRIPRGVSFHKLSLQFGPKNRGKTIGKWIASKLSPPPWRLRALRWRWRRFEREPRLSPRCRG